ncbi:MAG: hypothetical protein AB7U20_16925 [Planctomycetaceae bacterium]
MLAFIHIEAAVGPAVSDILRQSFGLGHCDLVSWRQYGRAHASPRLADLKHALQFYPALESVSGHLVVPHCGYERLRRDIRYFTLLREPLERSAAQYLEHVRAMGKEAPPFDGWISQEACRNLMTKKLGGTGNSDDAIQMLETRVGCTGLAERLDESLLLIRRWANRPQLDIRSRQLEPSAGDSGRQQLLTDPRSRDALIDANLEDIRLHLYVANELFPRQLAGYGSTLPADLEEFRASNQALPRSPWLVPGLVYRDAVYRRAAQISTAVRRAA